MKWANALIGLPHLLALAVPPGIYYACVPGSRGNTRRRLQGIFVEELMEICPALQIIAMDAFDVAVVGSLNADAGALSGWWEKTRGAVDGRRWTLYGGTNRAYTAALSRRIVRLSGV